MAKTASVGLKIEPELKRIAEQAAKMDRRSLASLVEKLLVDHCVKIGLIESASALSGDEEHGK